MPHILVIEDEPAVRSALLRTLAAAGWATSSAGTGMSGLEALVRGRPDLVVLDLGLPDVDGVALLRMLRAVNQVPVIVASAQDQDRTVVAALDAGADDYVIKPFGADTLAARIRAVLRRGADAGPTATVLVVGGLELSVETRTAVLDGAVLELSPKEFDLLTYLARRPGHVISKRELLAEVWSQPYTHTDKTVDVHLSWLRAKLGETARVPRYLHTVRGVGVKVSPPAPID